VPPLVKYHSAVPQRLNPNLYEDGKVCLSLLGTWSGPGWTPTSTVLQVLTSIQGLVLVEDPFFNEPGYEKSSGTAEGRQNARQYNENARLLSLRSTVNLVRRPPAGMEAVVADHLKARGAAVVARAEREIAEAVGAAGGGGGGAAAGPSEGYIRMLGRLLPTLRSRLGGARRAGGAGGQ